MKRLVKAAKSNSFDPVERGWHRDSLLKPSELDDDPELFTFKFCFKDGNQQIFDAENIYDALSYVLFVKKQYIATDIWKIEEVED